MLITELYNIIKIQTMNIETNNLLVYRFEQLNNTYYDVYLATGL